MKRLGRLTWPSVFPWLITALLLFLLAEKIISGAKALGFVLEVTVVPLLISLALAYLLEPLVNFFESRGLQRWQASLTTLLLGLVVLTLIAIFALPRIGAQLVETGQKLPAAAAQVVEKIKPKLEALHQINPTMYDRVRDQVSQGLDDPSGILQPAIGYVRSGLLGLVNITASLLNLILIPFFAYYILNEARTWTNEAATLIPPRHRQVVAVLGERIDHVASNFVRGQLIVSAAMSVFYIIGFLLLGVPLAFTLGILSGFGNLIPYVGGLIATALTVLIVAVERPELWRIFGVIGVYFLVQSLEGFWLTPRILGDRLELHPFVVILGVLIGGSLFGILGIILAAPTMAIAKVLLQFGKELYLNSSFYHTANLVLPAPPTDTVISVPLAEPTEPTA